ncbi:MAG: hypothetical protein U0869_19745 [Chloroflexota bacterium]
MSRSGMAIMAGSGYAAGVPKQRSSRLGAMAAIMGGAALAIGMLPGTASAAAPLVQFDANYNDCAIYGIGPRLTTIKVSWKDADGTFKHVQTVKSKANGMWQTTCDPDESVEKGDVFLARIGTKSRQFVVPPLNVRIDRVTDTISGKAPADTQLKIDLPTKGSKDATSDGGGAYSYNASLAGEDLIGSQWITTSFTTASGDVVERSLQVPYVLAYRGRALIKMVGRPGSIMQVDLQRAASTIGSVRCALGPTGTCWLSFTDDDGHTVKVQADDVIAIQGISDGSFVVRNITVSGVPTTDVISGSCDTNRATPWYLEAYRPVGAGFVSRAGTTTTAGTFSRDVTSKYDLRSGDKVFAECQSPAGDWIARFITVP